MALEGLAAFALGALVSSKVSFLRRALVRKKARSENVLRAGRAAFYELGVSATSGRNGILVFVSTFERSCVLVPDLGIHPERLGAAYEAVCNDAMQAVAQMNLDAFFSALEQLGPVLGRAMPRQADDVNELPDEVQ